MQNLTCYIFFQTFLPFVHHGRAALQTNHHVQISTSTNIDQMSNQTLKNVELNKRVEFHTYFVNNNDRLAGKRRRTRQNLKIFFSFESPSSNFGLRIRGRGSLRAADLKRSATMCRREVAKRLRKSRVRLHIRGSRPD